MTTTRITSVTVQQPEAADIGAQSLRPIPLVDVYVMPGTVQGALYIGNVAVVVGGFNVTPDAARRQATAMEAIAAHAQDVADQLLAWADQVEDARSADAVLAETTA